MYRKVTEGRKIVEGRKVVAEVARSSEVGMKAITVGGCKRHRRERRRTNTSQSNNIINRTVNVISKFIPTSNCANFSTRHLCSGAFFL